VALGYAVKHATTLAGLVLTDVGPELNLTGANKRLLNLISQERVLDFDWPFVARAMAFNPRCDPTLDVAETCCKICSGCQPQMDLEAWSQPNVDDSEFAYCSGGVFSDEKASKFTEALLDGRCAKVALPATRFRARIRKECSMHSTRL
jgi:hypothetical protein